MLASCSVDVQNLRNMDVSCKLQCGCSVSMSCSVDVQYL